ncbi:hypothetical protein EIP91_010157 [Steccherinum ochraceum]|uniref:Histone deacetylase complex subunit SAP30 Sin3 binding domain-containing protein n=1 Tax=Steccherinum ochraceum TaxID=92696 RepID=A0A4R0RRL6_9APHY|nr:hypothetical protein EIP91_010157 [Steccherinum ochraceum]
MPITATAPPPSASVAPTSGRARPQAGRRKANTTADDAAYHGTVTAGTKRGAAEKADGEPRGKRKRAEANSGVGAVAGPSSGAGMRRTAADKAIESDGTRSAVDFATLPTEILHRYLSHFDLIPEVDPSPATANDPPPPSTLLVPRSQRHSASQSPPPLPVTPANRPRREASASAASRRRSSRMLEEDLPLPAVPVLADVSEFHGMLAVVAERHFREHAVKEVETLTSFMYTLKAKGFGHVD